jgi:O-antigen/teichoic acid export membrane protein
MKKALFDSFIWRSVYFITTLLLNVCIARVYEATQSGWIYFISNNFYLVLLVGTLSLDSSMTYFSASNQISPNKLALFGMTWPIVVGLLSVVCTGFLIKSHYITSDYLFLLVAGSAYTFGIALTNFFTSLFYAKQNYAIPNVLMSIINLLLIAVIPFFAKGYFGLNRQQFLYVYFIQFIVQGAGLALLYSIRYSPIHSLTYPKKDECRKLFRFAIVALGANIAYYLINRVDYLFVEAWCSAKSLGNYVQVSKMGQLFLIIPTIISSAVYPQAAKGDNENVIKLILRIVSLFILLYAFIIIGAYLFSDKLFIWLFGNTFDEMYVPFLVLLPGILFLSIHIIIAAFFGGKNKPMYNVITTGAGLIVVLAGDILLIKPMGITGAALVSSAGYTTAFVVSLLLFLKRTGSNLQQIFTPDIFQLKTYTSLIANPSSNNK